MLAIFPLALIRFRELSAFRVVIMLLAFGAPRDDGANEVAAASNAQPSVGDLAQRFLTQAPAKWKEYRAYLPRLQGTVESKQLKNGNVLIDVGVQIKQNGANKLYIEQRRAWDGSRAEATMGTVVACNREYAFRLTRSAERDTWIIGSLESIENPSAYNQLVGNAALGVATTECLLTLSGARRLDQLVEQRAFRVLKARAVEAGAFEITFDCVHPLEEKPFFPIQRGVIVLDPKHFYCLRSAEVECLWRAKGGPRPALSQLKTEYSISTQGYPVPISWSEQTDKKDASGAPVKVVSEVHYTLREASQPPSDEEFTLAAFGFAEPDAETATTRWLLWGGLIGILCIVVGYLVVRLTSRRAQARAN